MSDIEIKVPTLPESVTDATIAKWYKKEGDHIGREENLLDLETDKVMLEVVAPKAGIIKEIKHQAGDSVTTDQVLAILEEESADTKATKQESKKEAPKKEDKEETKAAPTKEESTPAPSEDELSPAVRRLISEHNVDLNQIKGTGKGGRVTKTDVEAYLEKQDKEEKTAAPAKAAAPKTPTTSASSGSDRLEKRVPMSRLRQRVAERLVAIQQEGAILTTFNEVNMKAVMDLRNQFKTQFEKAHDVRLGFMSFFVKATIEALKRFPVVNASIDGTDILYHNYFDIGIAIGSPRGLVVPILRNADQMSMADIEKKIREYAELAKTGKLSIEDMTGGTFTITNGGTYGSMLSTPIINPPQSAILGMHNIVERPIVEDGQIVARPVMYLALSYDHRIIDGRESVQFLYTIKEMLENPARLLLEV